MDTEKRSDITSYDVPNMGRTELERVISAAHREIRDVIAPHLSSLASHVNEAVDQLECVLTLGSEIMNMLPASNTREEVESESDSLLNQQLPLLRKNLRQVKSDFTTFVGALQKLDNNSAINNCPGVGLDVDSEKNDCPQPQAGNLASGRSLEEDLTTKLAENGVDNDNDGADSSDDPSSEEDEYETSSVDIKQQPSAAKLQRQVGFEFFPHRQVCNSFKYCVGPVGEESYKGMVCRTCDEWHHYACAYQVDLNKPALLCVYCYRRSNPYKTYKYDPRLFENFKQARDDNETKCKDHRPVPGLLPFDCITGKPKQEHADYNAALYQKLSNPQLRKHVEANVEKFNKLLFRTRRAFGLSTHDLEITDFQFLLDEENKASEPIARRTRPKKKKKNKNSTSRCGRPKRDWSEQGSDDEADEDDDDDDESVEDECTYASGPSVRRSARARAASGSASVNTRSKRKKMETNTAVCDLINATIDIATTSPMRSLGTMSTSSEALAQTQQAFSENESNDEIVVTNVISGGDTTGDTNIVNGNIDLGEREVLVIGRMGSQPPYELALFVKNFEHGTIECNAMLPSYPQNGLDCYDKYWWTENTVFPEYSYVPSTKIIDRRPLSQIPGLTYDVDGTITIRLGTIDLIAVSTVLVKEFIATDDDVRCCLQFLSRFSESFLNEQVPMNSQTNAAGTVNITVRQYVDVLKFLASSRMRRESGHGI